MPPDDVPPLPALVPPAALSIEASPAAALASVALKTPSSLEAQAPPSATALTEQTPKKRRTMDLTASLLRDGRAKPMQLNLLRPDGRKKTSILFKVWTTPLLSSRAVRLPGRG
jgi:hypothetical protein